MNGLKAMEEKLETRSNKTVLINFIVKLMEVVLNHNIFEFHDGLWNQSRPVPKYANIFMAKINDQIKDIAMKYDIDNSEGLKVLKRFLDDFFLLFSGTTKQLHKIFEEANKINPTIQFTMSHTSPTKKAVEDQCDCEKKSEIPFFDTLVSFKNGFLDTDIYQKETDHNQYLLPSSCHVKQTTAAIPYFLSLRVVKVCSDPKNREI